MSAPERVVFDPHDPRFADDGVPFEALERIRREEPVYRTPSGSWYLSRFADVEAALQDVETFRAELGPITGIPAGVLSIPEDQHFLSEIPEPRHGKIRRLFNSVLGAHRVKDIDPVIEAECHRLVDVMLQTDVADLHGQYAAAIPAFTMAHFLGVGSEAAPLFMQWSMDGTVMTRPATPGVGPQGPATHTFFQELLAQQRALPEPSIRLIRVFLEAEIDGRPLTDREIVTQLHFMLQAGVHTTRGFLTHLMNRLVQDPEILPALRADDGADCASIWRNRCAMTPRCSGPGCAPQTPRSATWRYAAASGSRWASRRRTGTTWSTKTARPSPWTGPILAATWRSGRARTSAPAPRSRVGRANSPCACCSSASPRCSRSTTPPTRRSRETSATRRCSPGSCRNGGVSPPVPMRLIVPPRRRIALHPTSRVVSGKGLVGDRRH